MKNNKWTTLFIGLVAGTLSIPINAQKLFGLNSLYVDLIFISGLILTLWSIVGLIATDRNISEKINLKVNVIFVIIALLVLPLRIFGVFEITKIYQDNSHDKTARDYYNESVRLLSMEETRDNWFEAKHNIEDALKLDKDNSEYLVQKLRVCLRGAFDRYVTPNIALDEAKLIVNRFLYINDRTFQTDINISVAKYYRATLQFSKADSILNNVDQNNPILLREKAWLWLCRKKYTDALVFIEGAFSKDIRKDKVQNAKDMSTFYFHSGQYEAGINKLMNLEVNDQNNYEVQSTLALLYSYLGRKKEAINACDKSQPIDFTKNANLHINAACVYALIGNKKKAKQLLEEIKSKLNDNLDPYLSAEVYACLGDVESSMNNLDKAGEEKSLQLCFILTDPLLNRIRNQQRFKIFVDKLGIDKRS